MRRMKIREASKVVNNSEAFHSDIQFWSMFELPLLSLLVTDWRHICPTMLGLSRIVRLHVSPFKRRLLAYYLRTHGETCAECRTVILIRAQIYILFISFITFHFISSLRFVTCIPDELAITSYFFRVVYVYYHLAESAPEMKPFVRNAEE